MNHRLIALGCVAAALAAGNSPAAMYYVSQSAGNDTNSGTSWRSAKKTIQEAVNRAVDGDTVVVTSGVYSAGGKVTPGEFSMNRVCIENNITVSSLYGKVWTTIVGRGPAGEGAVRCAYVGCGLLAGFTLSNGYTQAEGNIELNSCGGGVLGNAGADWWNTEGTVSNCLIIRCSAMPRGYGGGAYGASLVGCTLWSNQGLRASGAYRSILKDCTLVYNVTTSSVDCTGGAGFSLLENCIVTANYASAVGGADWATLSNCVLMANRATNSAFSVGGARASRLYGCTVVSNYGATSGGASGGVLVDCLLWGNWCMWYGGGAGGGAVLTNCTVRNNRSQTDGGGLMDATAYNCSIVSNTALASGGGVCASEQGAATLYNCLVTRNFAFYGGGVHRTIMYNSTVADNTSSQPSGGTCGDGNGRSYAYNSIVYFNTCLSTPAASNYYVWFDPISGSFQPDTHFISSDTAPLATNEGSSFVMNADPQFVARVSNDFHLPPSSPCVNQGMLSYVYTDTDLDGNPRVVDGVVDLGCYEYSPTSKYALALGPEGAVPEPAAAAAALLFCIAAARLRARRA